MTRPQQNPLEDEDGYVSCQNPECGRLFDPDLLFDRCSQVRYCSTKCKKRAAWITKENI